VLAALGLVVSPARRDAQRSVFLSGEGLTGETIAIHTDELAARARDALGDADAAVRIVYETRYAGQSFELPIDGHGSSSPDRLREAFEAEHERRYGYRDPDAPLELVTIRASATLPGPELTPAAAPQLPARLDGPAVHHLPESTLLVPAGWRGRTDAHGTIHLLRAG
jgi:N-methylhydantoinase A